MLFENFGLSHPILKAIELKKYKTATPIQEKSIPVILDGKDVIASAQTGTGKTAGFSLPIIEKLLHTPRPSSRKIKTLILTPTRELAGQIFDCIQSYSVYTQVKAQVVFGGVKINPQISKLRQGTHILVATPGRLLDLAQNNAVDFSEVEIFVLDEADRMLDMGFIKDIKKIINKLPKARQNLMFSATFSKKIRELAQSIVNSPVEISVTPPNTTTQLVDQKFHPVDKKKKPALLVHLIKENKWKQALVFTRTKHGANRLTTYLHDRGIVASAIHGNKSQNARTKALQQFKSGELQILVATDIAARGLDIEQLPQVVNFDLPNISEDYVHRIGRTGRAGLKGKAISLVSADEIDYLSDIEKFVKKKLKREYVSGYEPTHEVPQTSSVKATKASNRLHQQYMQDNNKHRSNNNRRRRKSSTRARTA